MSLGIALSLKGAEFRYPGAVTNTIHSLDLEIRPGEWVVLLGSNGSGKSTLMKLFNALLIPTQGVCFVDGHKTEGDSAPETVRSQVSMVFQNPEDQIVAAIVEEDTAFGPENLGIASEEIRERVCHALISTGLWEKRKAPVSSLSGGQKQRLAIAGVLAIAPRAILLDEAMSMLDPSARKDFMNIVKEQHNKGTTIVQVTHNLDEIVCSDRVVVLEAGQIVWQGTPEVFLAKSTEELRAMNFAKPAIAVLRDRLIKMKILQDSVKSEVKAIKDALCQ